MVAAAVQRPAEAEPAARPWRDRLAAEAPGAVPAGRHEVARRAAGRPQAVAAAEPGAEAGRLLEAEAAARPWSAAAQVAAAAVRPDAAVALPRAAEVEGEVPEQPRAEAARVEAAARPAAERPCVRLAGPARPGPGPSAPA